MQTGLAATGRFETENASKYLQQLCKHFAHKVQARCDDRSGEVALGTGPCRLWADASELRVEVMAPDAEELDQAKRIVDSHLERFAFREDFTTMSWT